MLEDADNGIPMLARRVLIEVNERIRELAAGIPAYDREIEVLARDSEAAHADSGVGTLTATAILASIPDMRTFKNGRQFAAGWAWRRANTPPAAR